MKTLFKVVAVVFGIVCVFACGLAVRFAVLRAQYRYYGSVPPFTSESALEYRLVKHIVEKGDLPVRDLAVQTPEGIVLRETYTVGAEYIYAFFARLLPSSYSLTDRVRLISAAWFSLGGVFLTFWLWFWLRSRLAALLGGSFYAVSLASVIRSTGQELSHENFALPLLLAHIAVSAFAASIKNAKAFWIATVLSAALLACAAATWDLIQFYLLLWAVWSFARLARGNYFLDLRRSGAWLVHLIALIIVGIWNPYLRAHSFLACHAMLLSYGVAIGLAAERCAEGRRLLKAAVVLLLLALGILVLPKYKEAYDHFYELLWAKIRFLNQKPADPALLTFAQRIMWTPALNSVDYRLTKMLFPFILPLIVLVAPVVSFLAPRRSDPELGFVLFCFVVSLPTFVLFARFHVFLIIFTAALLGWLAWSSLGLIKAGGSRRFGLRPRWAGGVILVLLLAGTAAEAGHTLSRPERWGRNLLYVPEQEELAAWLRVNGGGNPVLANFSLSPFILVYGGCPIVLHPKFESREIRDRVRAYGEALFKSDEKAFRAWADSYGASFYVFALGEFSSIHQELQMRYFVDALEPPPHAAALLFDRAPESARYFQFLWGNAKYRVFRVITRADESEASRYSAEAFSDLTRGDLSEAEVKAELALIYAPYDEQAARVLLEIESLKQNWSPERRNSEHQALPASAGSKLEDESRR